MSGLSNYFHPDDVMLALAGLLSDGLKYHAAAMQLVSADDQVDDLAYEEAIEQAEKGSQDPKMVVAKLFAENRNAIFMIGAASSASTTREFYKPQLTLKVTFNRMRRRFVREIARITRVPVMKPPSNINIPDQNMPMHIPQGNVTSMEGWREKQRKRA
jgi:hypothetical protein